jgi:hypothetical protein
MANSDLMDYKPVVDPTGKISAVKANSDPQYKKSLDFSTMCIKRYIMQNTVGCHTVETW